MSSTANLNNITHIFYDFDGVMTDNRVLVDETGTEAVFCNRSDGLAVSKLKEAGYTQLILSTEVNSVVEQRAEKLKLPVIHGVSDKGVTLRSYMDEHKISKYNAIFIGNDLNDIPAFNLVGVKMCPSDAEEVVKSLPGMIIINRKSGEGVIRELYRMMTEHG